jgi:hypothetical protein
MIGRAHQYNASNATEEASRWKWNELNDPMQRLE